MSMPSFTPPGGGSGSGADIVTQLQGIVNQLSSLVTAWQGRMVFGTFTLGAAATTVVPDTAARSNSVMIPFPTNAAAATLMAGVNSLYVSAFSSGTSFTVATAAGGLAAGTETFAYVMFTPV